MKHAISTRWLANLNWGRSHFPHDFEAYMNILFIIKATILILIKRSYRFPKLCWLWSLEWLSYSKHTVQSLINTSLFISVLGTTPNHIPLKHRCPNKESNRIRDVYLRLSSSSVKVKWADLGISNQWETLDFNGHRPSSSSVRCPIYPLQKPHRVHTTKLTLLRLCTLGRKATSVRSEQRKGWGQAPQNADPPFGLSQLLTPRR